MWLRVICGFELTLNWRGVCTYIYIYIYVCCVRVCQVVVVYGLRLEYVYIYTHIHIFVYIIHGMDFFRGIYVDAGFGFHGFG